MSFIDRLRLLIDEREKGNIAAFAKRCGIKDSSLHQYLGGTLPSFDQLVKIAKSCGVSLDWLMLGENTNTSKSSADEVLVQFLPFKASAGHGNLIVDDDAGGIAFPKSVLDRHGLNSQNVRILEASGTSMTPTINDGDLMLIDVSQQSPIDNQIYAFTIDNELFVKRLCRVPGQGWEIVSDNPTVPRYPMPKGEHIRILGRVKWTERAL